MERKATLLHSFRPQNPAAHRASLPAPRGTLSLRHLKRFAVGLCEPRPHPRHSQMAANGPRTERETCAYQNTWQRRCPDGPGPCPSWDQLNCAPSSGLESHMGSDSAMSATPEALPEGGFAPETRKTRRGGNTRPGPSWPPTCLHHRSVEQGCPRGGRRASFRTSRTRCKPLSCSSGTQQTVAAPAPGAPAAARR